MLQRDPSSVQKSQSCEVAALVKGVTPVKEAKGTQPLKICQQSAGFEYMQCQFESPALQMLCIRSGGVDRGSLCSHLLRQRVADMKVAGTWQMSSSARGKYGRTRGLACVCMLVCFTVLPPYGDTQGGVLRRRFSPRSLGVLETMMRQMIGIKVVDCSCSSFSQRFQAVQS
jgi:hypothetical protein